jgi:hypothetical protein
MPRLLVATHAVLLAACDADPATTLIVDGAVADAPVTASDARPSPDARPMVDGGTNPGLPMPFDVGVTYTRELVVAQGGDLHAAVQRATPGTRIVLEAGTYPGGVFLEDVNGAPGQPIAIVGAGHVIIDARGVAEGLHIAQAQYLVLENLEIFGAGANGLNIDDAGSADTPTHHLVLRNLRVRDVGSGGNHDCIKLSGVDDFFVVGSTVARCNAGDMIDQVGCHRGVIAGNRFEGSPAGGIQMKGGSSDTLVHGNVFVDVSGRVINAGGSTGLEFFRPLDAPHEAARLTVTANVMLRCGAQSGAAIAYVGCDGCVFANNTILEPRRWILIVFRVADLDGYSWFNVGANTAPQTFTLGNNLWYALDDPSFAAPRLRDVPAESGSLVQRDPMLADRAAGDAHIPLASPARGAGRAAAAPAVDHDGRAYASPPAIGAFEAR